MAKDSPAQSLDRIMVRLPDGMRERLTEVAKEKGRSVNAEVVARLEASFDIDAAAQDLADTVSLHDGRLDALEDALQDLKDEISGMSHNMGEIIRTGGPSRDMR